VSECKIGPQHGQGNVALPGADDILNRGLGLRVQDEIILPEPRTQNLESSIVNHLRGKFIVFDGNEGCGKSTQAALVSDRLLQMGMPVLRVRDPGTTRIGEKIREILLDPKNKEMGMRCEMFLYMAARAQMMKEIIFPALSEGSVVISDRFVSSTLAYQLHGDGMTEKEIRAVANVAIQGRWPDLTLILDMPVERSAVRVDPQLLLTFPGFKQRDDRDRIERRPLEYHLQVRKNYLSQARRNRRGYRVIKADRSIEEVHADVWATISELGKK
jgi:dTMP kinase